MNLALRDIRHHSGRFVLTTVGIGLLLMIVMGMGGIYRGLIHEAILLVDRIDADVGHRGRSRLHTVEDLHQRLDVFGTVRKLAACGEAHRQCENQLRRWSVLTRGARS